MVLPLHLIFLVLLQLFLELLSMSWPTGIRLLLRRTILFRKIHCNFPILFLFLYIRAVNFFCNISCNLSLTRWNRRWLSLLLHWYLQNLYLSWIFWCFVSWHISRKFLTVLSDCWFHPIIETDPRKFWLLTSTKCTQPWWINIAIQCENTTSLTSFQQIGHHDHSNEQDFAYDVLKKIVLWWNRSFLSLSNLCSIPRSKSSRWATRTYIGCYVTWYVIILYSIVI